MPNLKNPAFLPALLLLSLVLLALWNVNWMFNQRAVAASASADLDTCHDLESTISAMRHQTTLATSQAIESPELGQRIAAAAVLAQLNLDSLQGVFPQPSLRVGNLPYVEKPTDLFLRKVTLRPFASLLYNLTDSSGLSVLRIHLRTPHGEAASNLWDVDATITSLIYAPIDNARGD